MQLFIGAGNTERLHLDQTRDKQKQGCQRRRRWRSLVLREPEPLDLVESLVLHFAPETWQVRGGRLRPRCQTPFAAFLPDCPSGLRTSIVPASTDGADGADSGADVGPKLELSMRVEQWSPTFWYQGLVS